MFPDYLNFTGIVSLVFLGVFCALLTFRAWNDGQCRDFKSLKSHLRIIGVAQLVIILTALSIGSDMIVAAKMSQRLESEASRRPDYFSPNAVMHASR